MAGKHLNLGCGKAHLKGYINIDVNETLKPDLVHDFILEPLPYKDGEIDGIVLSHVIEHIPKSRHPQMVKEFHRVLKLDEGSLFLAYPEFKVCAANYIENKNGKRAYWEATIFGRQTSQWDFHVSLMDTEFYVLPLLEASGFGEINYKAQDQAEYNTILRAIKVTEELPTLERMFKAGFKRGIYAY